MKKVYTAIALAVILSGCASGNHTPTEEPIINNAISKENIINKSESINGDVIIETDLKLYGEIATLLKQDFDKKNLALEIKHKRALQEIEEWSVSHLDKELQSDNLTVVELQKSLQKVAENPNHFTPDEVKLVSLNLKKSEIELQIKSIKLEVETRLQKESLLKEQNANFNNEKLKILNWYNNNIEILVLRDELQARSSSKLKELNIKIDSISNQIQEIESAELGWESND